MRRLLALLLPLALLAGTGTSQASTTEITYLPGCYGAGTVINCDLRIYLRGAVGAETGTFPVCLGACYEVPVLTPATSPDELDQTHVCMDGTRLSDGERWTDCYGYIWLRDFALWQADNIRLVEQTVCEVEAIEEHYDCPALAGQVFDVAADTVGSV